MNGIDEKERSKKMEQTNKKKYRNLGMEDKMMEEKKMKGDENGIEEKQKTFRNLEVGEKNEKK